MKRVIFWMTFLLLIAVFTTEDIFAIGNGEVVPNRLTIRYNVQAFEKVKAIVLEGEYGLTSTLALEGRYIYTSPASYLDTFIKFKLHEERNLNVAGRVGLHSDFDDKTPVNKILGIVFSKDHNSFIQLHGGVTYSMTTEKIGYFAGLDYQLSARSYFQAGWQKFVGQSETQGWVFGLRTDI
ncbi:hypothetical protein BBF96_10855 [Anoxybacter fermentans]|uniref:Outer membrane protein beta-barrel domain-containing protein n=1 Tax=Anoxybacter fermentans TaxID=1323375 RepID=A0A3S9SZV9_9FIRM|nr:hypothetical protein [Anoxybacter fermentans]AZR73841.1 hypothetical protein BBF96_10855 [Anoxybacter fermentans]